MEPKVSVKHHNLRIKWQFSTIDIPVSDITDVTLDDTYAGEEKRAITIRPHRPGGNQDQERNLSALYKQWWHER